jgi:ISXO2-like transposase domain
MNIFEFMQRFDTFKKIDDFLLRENIVSDQIICSCGNPMKRVYKTNKCRYFFRCIKKSCRKETSCYYGTIFENASLPFTKIMIILFLWTKKISIMKIVDITNISHKTVSSYIKQVESLICCSLDEEDCIIGGPGIMVQIDESKFGKRKYNRGHPVDGVWILGGVEITPERKIFLKVINNRNANTLVEIITSHVRTGSIIVTDCWRGYSRLGLFGYEHKTVNHSEVFVNEEGFHTNNIEGTWSSLKRNTSARNRTENLIKGKLFEYIWRRKNEGNIWNALIEAIRMGHIH